MSAETRERLKKKRLSVLDLSRMNGEDLKTLFEGKEEIA